MNFVIKQQQILRGEPSHKKIILFSLYVLLKVYSSQFCFLKKKLPQICKMQCLVGINALLALFRAYVGQHDNHIG